ncbi:transcriptional activator domain [Thermosinus carboxydivorans Nor1]|uniref:Transcriptional activator domain n=1 Tax=Thermosinus carboxydivorans Nor1 TaxID=401526 RepID=A1HM46_9FIRM|nr:transcriptional activator domain [Thermosinus carboxydivorans Nor1]
MQPVVLLRSKLNMPKLDNDVILRTALKAKLADLDKYPVTVVSAGAGYGKTTALVQALTQMSVPCGWYNPGPEDDNVYIFSAYLAGALEPLAPGITNWYLNNIAQEEKFDWKKAFQLLMAGLEDREEQELRPGILVVDDWHFVQTEPEIRLFFDRFLACRRPTLHVVILSREKINLPEIDRLRAKGKVLEFSEQDLAFSYQEIHQFINNFLPVTFTQQEVEQIYKHTEGWIIAIRLILNSLANKPKQNILSQAEYENMEILFEYLAHDVLVRQPEPLQMFLLKSSILESFHAQMCQEILGDEFSYDLLALVRKRGLFLSEIDKGIYRYHNLFREFLRREASKRVPDLQTIHVKAGDYYLRHGEEEQALYHLILGKQWDKAVAILRKISRNLVYSGRGRVLCGYLQQLPAMEHIHPDIIMALGDEARFACNYKKAIGLYEQAAANYSEANDFTGVSNAYRGIGETYLDIIQPLQAQLYLRRAYKALTAEQGKEKAAILGLMAENMINRGNPRRAERYRRLAREFNFEDKNNLEARILLRTGRIYDAIKVVERQLSREKSYHIPCSFRESSLILSLCYAYSGQPDKALATAKEGIRVGEKLRSPFITAVGYIRLAHALLIQLPRDKEQCWLAYQKGLDIGSKLDILRSRTEVLQGQCLLHALENDWSAAKSCGHSGVKITEQVQDRWFTAVLYHTLGMSAAICQQFTEAKAYLQAANRLFHRCGDNFGKAAGAWWLAYIALHRQQPEEFQVAFHSLLSLCNTFGYHFLLERPTLLGDITGFTSKPFFNEAVRLGLLTEEQSAQTAPTFKDTRPGFSTTLRIQALGSLKVWRDGREIVRSDWRRESSRHLFCLLLTARHAGLHKETIMSYLWPEADYEAAARNFKVTLHNLMNILEPARQPRKPSSFIQRQGAVYQWNLTANFWLDVDEFEHAIMQAMNIVYQQPCEAELLLRKSIALYRGDYLEGEQELELYTAERERLVGLYIKAAELMAKLCIRQQRYEEALNWTDVIVKKDKCWEKAYQIKMWCYGKMKNPVMVARTYKKCCETLREELAVKPSYKTTEIYRKFTD